MSGTTLFDKIWSDHVIRDLGDGWSLLHIDRHLLHDMSGPPALVQMRRRGLAVHDPTLSFAMPDHLVSSSVDRGGQTSESSKMLALLTRETATTGIRMFGLDDDEQGIVHVTGPEQGIVLPGLTVICGDSHTCTNGALGALAFGVGSSQIVQALASQVLAQQRPMQMRITLHGALQTDVSAKDVALFLIARLGASVGVGFAIEYAGSTVEEMDVEARLTLCNLTVELGAKFGIIRPDELTVAWIADRPFSPRGAEFEHARAAWRTLRTDDDAVFDVEHIVDAREITPMITWGTSPEHAVAIDGVVPDVADHVDALDYMGLRRGDTIAGTPIDWVFIGSCTNGRLSDLRSAAAVVIGRTVAPGVTAWVVPGSASVRRQAEAEGLHRVFIAAGMEWRQPGCSMCVAANGERVPPGERCVSTSNRNFVGRQGPGARTHLASPATAAAAAIAGRIVDVRTM